MVEPMPASDVVSAPSTASYLDGLARQIERDPDYIPLFRVRPRARGFDTEGLSYGEIAHRTRAFARYYRERGVGPGDRVLMSMADPHQLLAAIVGAMSMGAVSVPLQTSAEFRTSDLFRERMRRVAEDCEPRLVLVEDLARWQATWRGAEGQLPAVPVEQVPTVTGTVPTLEYAHLPPETPAIIQYTSGSTGSPRGVVLTHRNILANTLAISAGTDTQERESFVTWLPLHHDMGLIPLLWGMYSKLRYHVMSPVAFLTRPVVWLRAIHEFRAAQTVAPNFAYGLCWRKIPDSQLAGLDLSTWRLAYCGAEPIDPVVVRGFVERFGPYGFRPTSFFPVYGLAEATLAAAFPPPGTAPVFDVVDREALARRSVAMPVSETSSKGITFVSVGAAVRDHALEIRDPDSGRPCPERQVGEIVLRGPAVSPRYFHEDPASARTELHTGDLGYVAGANVFVIDRLKDLVIVRGQNFLPADLEPRAAEVPGLRPGRVAAFSLPGGNGTEALHFVAELDPRSWRSQTAIARDLTRRILARFGIEVAGIALVAPGMIPRTSSGKLRRRACRDAYAAGEYRSRLSWWARLGIRGNHFKQTLRVAMARGLRPGGAQ